MHGDPILLTVGICDCTDLYHGFMEGHHITVPELTGHRYFGWHYFVPLEKPLVFRIREVRIPERHEQEALEGLGCHFFVDVHAILQLVVLHIMYPIPEDPAGPDKSYISELDQSTIEWQGKMAVWSPPTVQEVKGWMSQLLRRMDKQGLQQWLRMVSLNMQTSTA